LIDRAARAWRDALRFHAARHAAEEALLDLTLVRVDPETYARFLDLLDNSHTDDGYRRLMASPKPWST